MVSALYRLEECCIDIAYRQNFFSDLLLSDEVGISSAKEASDLAGDKLSQTITSIRNHIHSMSLQLNTFQGELLLTSLSLVLNMPVGLLPFQEIIPSIKISLTTGFQVHYAVRSIECHIVQKSFSKYLPEILPLLNQYLIPVQKSQKGVAIKSRQSVSYNNVMNVKTKSVTQSSLRNESNNGRNQSLKAEQDDNVQYEIIRLLGRLGGLNKMILDASTDASQSSMKPPSDYSAITKELINIALPLSKSDKLDVTLDPILNRLLELCGQSDDVQLKVLAGESLHSLVIFLIGKAASDFSSYVSNSESPFESIYGRVFPVILSLSCSTDKISQNLFEKLLFQLIHWFSGYQQVHVNEAKVMVDTLIDGLCHTCDITIREMSSR
jgi:DNA-dependent protein kinase catalytic subunit